MSLPPRPIIAGVTSGLFLMSFFTLLWLTNLFAVLPIAVAATLWTLGLLLAALFVTTAIRLLRVRAAFPAELSEADQRFHRRTGMWFGIVFGAEFVLIAAAAIILNATGRQDYVVPAIALVVGLHFYPFAPLFQRKIDYWLATWTTLVGLTGILLLALTGTAVNTVVAVVALGTACATIAYGLWNTAQANHLRRLASGATVPEAGVS
ncbi:hypothetical protein Acy02nite_56900 [Actinoplanes cyaneus]|uniref:Uncharacterized protein n=1 Tax=Actinoplanes cyaneus TaxID=52696 RepID=A0A919ILA8_9ACTN|nr:hypothetical protein [Actinoplanes cyaneus]MCW2139897.1 hypothetical protein [Actinoplanes cyaneus]GID67809.1 hypothetical protein Acy02nite_56900 [Actinoplanes cyaneus]